MLEEKVTLLPVKSDFVFKLIFGDQRNIDILASFLKSVLDIPVEEYESLTIVDPHTKKEHKNDKLGILDVKIHTKSGQVIHTESQVSFIPEMKERSVYYQSKMVTEQIATGQDYSVINRVISIIITDYVLTPDDEEYRRQYRYRTKDGKEFTNLVEINTLELVKLPLDTDGSELWEWLKFIKSDKEEEMEMLSERNPELKKAVGVLKELSADERTRMLYEEREKARRDIASMMGGARREGIEEGMQKGILKGIQKGKREQVMEFARKAISMSMDIDTIIKLTGLSREEIEVLEKN